MKIPDRVVAAAQEKLGYLHHDSIMRAAITAALEEWIASGEARKANAYNIGADSPNSDLCGCWVADERIPDSDDDAFPVLIIRMESEQ